MRVGQIAAALVLASAGCSCNDATSLLAVDLRTDFLAGREVAAAETEMIEGTSFETMRPVLRVSTPLSEGQDLTRRTRIAEFEDLRDGTYALRVRLLDATGARRGERLIVVTLDDNAIATAVILRRCEDVECPADRTCQAGACVDPSCTPESPESCGDPVCARDADCRPPECFRAVCFDGTCGEVPDESLCAPGDAGPSDAGPPAPIDGGPPVACTLDSQCDDDNPCTADACAMGTCAYTAVIGACDDGVFCNGFDGCAGGLCADHGGDPCAPSMCSEDDDACLGCPATPCPAPAAGPPGPCEYAALCDETGFRRRTVRTFACVGGVCEPSDTEEMIADPTCARPRGGVACAADVVPGTCTGFESECDTTGTTVTIEYATCSGGACPAGRSYVPAMMACTRPPPARCSGGECCGASCVDTSNDRSNCGACGIDCATMVDPATGMWRADTCRTGACICRDYGTICPEGSICCPDISFSVITCVNPSVDEAHCGGCNRPCGGTCSGGACI